jgi:hypothetical protein
MPKSLRKQKALLGLTKIGADLQAGQRSTRDSKKHSKSSSTTRAGPSKFADTEDENCEAEGWSGAVNKSSAKLPDDGDDSPSDSDDSSDDDIDDHERKPSKKNPKIIKDMCSLWQTLESDRTLLTVLHAQEKRCKVVIQNSDLNHLCSCTRQINTFMEVERQRVSVARLLSDTLKAHFKLRYGLSSQDLLDMTLTEMYSYLSAETKVKSKARFHEELEKALQDNPSPVIPWDNVEPKTHREFYFSQITYSDHFKMLLGIMLAANSDHVPRTDNKEGGMIRLFTKYNDRLYVNEVMAAMENYKWKDMTAFLQEFDAVTLALYEVSQVARQIPYKANKIKFAPKGDARVDTRGQGDARSQDVNPRSDPKGQPWNTARNVSFEKNRPRQPFSRPPDRHVSNAYGSDSKYDSADESYWDTDYEYGIDEEEVNWRAQYLNQDDSNIPSQTPQQIQNIVEASISAILGSGGGIEEFGCLKKIMHGTCTNKSCTYNHTSAAMDRTAKDIGGKCSSYLETGLPKPKATEGLGNAQPSAIMSRTHTGSRS